MAGQFTTRRNPDTGRIERIPEAEQGALRAAAEGIAPPPGAVTQRDMDFVNAGEGPPPLPGVSQSEPPPLPPQAPPVQPPPLPEDEDTESAAGRAAGTIASGSLGGPIAAGAAALTAGVSFAANQSLRKAPIGSFEGSGQTGGGDQEVLQQLLAVQRGIARVGAPVKNLVQTNPNGSRL